MGFPPRFALPSRPVPRVPFDRASVWVGNLSFDRVRTTLSRIPVDRIRIRRSAAAAELPLGPVRLGHDLTPSRAQRFAAALPLDRLRTAGAALPLGRVRALGAALPLERLGPIARLDRRVLAAIGLLLAASVYGLLIADPSSTVRARQAAAQAAAKPAPKPAAPADPFAQKAVNNQLRALRKSVEPGQQARNLVLLGDGTLGTTVASEGAWEHVMVRGSDLVVEPLSGTPDRATSLDLQRVRGTSITQILEQAETTFQLPAKQLVSLRLAESPSQPGTFIWTGRWSDPARTTLYADRDGGAVGKVLPR